ncbi:EAL domain-containing protein [uncultured Herbaspirillum sp.]|uniref:EAL domain-containing protein n=1 Tax=uncultured Herbaspirillum sp. TaxID=160236 RepID=UPI00258C63E4|nr:EAL domain-containing protein [uncultured Herbaspirillum sp.]
MKNKSKVVALALVATVVAAIAPVVGMLWLSRQAVSQAEHERLARYAQTVVERAESTFQATQRSLKSLSPLLLHPCSDEHIAQMRMIAVYSNAIEEMGYYEYGQLKCTSWERNVQAQRRAQPRPLFTTREGVGVAPQQPSFVAGGPSMMSIQYGSHAALVHRDRFVDVVLEDGVHVVLARNGFGQVAQYGIPIDPGIAAHALHGVGQQDVDGFFVSTVSRDGWTAAAIIDGQQVLDSMTSEQRWFLPVGVLLGLALVLLVVRVSQARLSPLAELQLAVRKREFIVCYQPIIELDSGRCVGAEALIRWKRPDGSIVRPDLFIPLAEESGLILPLTDLVIETVVAELGATLRADRALHVAINVAAQDIKTGRILEVVGKNLAGTDIRTEQIWMEATERGCMDIASARVTLARARELGHSMALDDFGTGYSNLQYLQGLPMDALKIDKSFVSTIGTGAATSAVIDHIIAMAKSLNLYIVAEGVETLEQAAYLSQQEVDFVQGWLFAKPMPAGEFVDFYRATLADYGTGPEIIRGPYPANEPASPLKQV